jgi:hypothetical protein
MISLKFCTQFIKGDGTPPTPTSLCLLNGMKAGPIGDQSAQRSPFKVRRMPRHGYLSPSPLSALWPFWSSEKPSRHSEHT